MTASAITLTLSAREAACVTGVPLKQVRRIVYAGLLDVCAGDGKHSRGIHQDGLVGLKLAHETMDMLTLDGRRRLVRFLLLNPNARTARERDVSVNVRTMRNKVRKGLSMLAKARDAVESDEAVLSGAPCVRRTRIPVHDIADMLANGDSAEAIGKAYPQLSETQIELAAFYVKVYPGRGRRPKLFWRARRPCASSKIALEELLPPP